MARYLGSVCKLCRREKDKLFLKGERCSTKCSLDTKRGKNPPGMHGTSRAKTSEYSIRLREKQKAKRLYGLTEQQFKHYFVRAEKIKEGLTGDNLIKLLELRLDNVIYRLGFGSSRSMARQMVNHGNVLVNDKKVNLPGYDLQIGDKVSISGKMQENTTVKLSIDRVSSPPSWLSFDKENLSGAVISYPGPEGFSHPLNRQLIVELYSK